MMRYEEGDLTDHRPCAGVRADLKMCLLESTCCKIVILTIYFDLKYGSTEGFSDFCDDLIIVFLSFATIVPIQLFVQN